MAILAVIVADDLEVEDLPRESLVLHRKWFNSCILINNVAYFEGKLEKARQELSNVWKGE